MSGGNGRDAGPGARAGARASLARLVEELASRQPGVSVASAGDVKTWSMGGRAIAAVGPTGVEFKLDRAIAAAAARTADAGPSLRGPEWVRFNPRELDAHAVDRVEAWFGLASRRAQG